MNIAAQQPPPVIVLAGGASRRFGRDKLTTVVAGRPLLEWTLHLLGAVEIVLVTRDSPDVIRIGHQWGARVVVAARAELGMAHSIVAGFAALTDGEAGAVITLGDDPLAARALPEVMAAAAATPTELVAVRRSPPVPHPVYVPRSCWALIAPPADGVADHGLRALLGDTTTWVETAQESAPVDLDADVDVAVIEAALLRLAPPSR